MNLTGILAISGMPGLFRLVGQMKNGIVVESLEDGKRFPAYASHKISALEDISMYSVDGDVNLGEVYDMIYKAEDGGTTISDKASSDELKAKMLEVFPNYDEERVYTSDIKKLFKWYNILHAAGVFSEEAQKAQEEELQEEE